DTKGPKMVGGDFSAEGRARQTLKDVELMLAQARKVGQDLPLARLNAEVLQACVRNGEGDQDNSIVINEIRRRVEHGPSRRLSLVGGAGDDAGYPPSGQRRGIRPCHSASSASRLGPGFVEWTGIAMAS